MVGAEPRYRLPVKHSLEDGAANFLLDNARPMLYEMLGNTVRENREQGVSFWTPSAPYPEELVMSKVHSGTLNTPGKKASISFPSPPPEPAWSWEIHTHPMDGVGGSISLSGGDWMSFTSLLQYPPRLSRSRRALPSERGFGVMTQRMGEMDNGEVTLKVVSPTDRYDDEYNDIDSQTEFVRELSEVVNSTNSIGRADAIYERFGEYIERDIVSFSIPKRAELLHFKDAIPVHKIGERRFGNAMGSGELVDVLSEVEYE